VGAGGSEGAFTRRRDGLSDFDPRIHDIDQYNTYQNALSGRT
jgi:hypothetical protein